MLDDVQRAHGGFIRNLLDATQSQAYTAFTTAGTSTAYTLTPSPAITAYAANQSFFVNFNAASGADPTLAISGIATPPNLVKENSDGTYSNIAANDIPINHRSRVTLISTTQALVERLPSIPGYSSGNQTITTGGALTLAHGLTKEPRIVILWLKCLTAEYGYSIGDKLLTNSEHNRVDGSPIGTSVIVNTTNIVIRYSSSATCFSAANATTGSATNLTNANWALVVEAFA
ncbi:MAG: hypothetical protein B7Y28_12345 [Polaromonas sp. 16-63-31]|nr:MAG: hypothetical protein B7Y60_15245 [Polaromonas sp. 35-63-35]OYZ19321.1 MAG: hypothetical protein B7Y28_12345 [Polaromonas sp. 16-63-31]OZA48464.1 MAG: hypothetical protein B7X88_18115 [Polaromonas sp. 17-63-33]